MRIKFWSQEACFLNYGQQAVRLQSPVAKF